MKTKALYFILIFSSYNIGKTLVHATPIFGKPEANAISEIGSNNHYFEHHFENALKSVAETAEEDAESGSNPAGSLMTTFTSPELKEPSAISSVNTAGETTTFPSTEERNPISFPESPPPLSYQRLKRSYDLTGELDLSQFYTPSGLTTIHGGGNELMTTKELEHEREKFLRLMSILSQPKSAGGQDSADNYGNVDDDDDDEAPPIDLGYYGSSFSGGKSSKTSKHHRKQAPEPVIELMSSHPKSKGRRPSTAGAGLDNKLIYEELIGAAEPDWLDDPIPIHRHRMIRRANNPVLLSSLGGSHSLLQMLRRNTDQYTNAGLQRHFIEGNPEFGYFGLYHPRKFQKRADELMEDSEIKAETGDQTPLYSLNQLLSKSQRPDTRFRVRHRYLL